MNYPLLWLFCVHKTRNTATTLQQHLSLIARENSLIAQEKCTKFDKLSSFIVRFIYCSRKILPPVRIELTAPSLQD